MQTQKPETVTLQKWGGLASFLLAMAFIIAPLIYLTGDLRTAIGPFAYRMADFLYGPVWAASLVTAVFALRERIGEGAPRRTTGCTHRVRLESDAHLEPICLKINRMLSG
jgi:hypothetical protein